MNDVLFPIPPNYSVVAPTVQQTLTNGSSTAFWPLDLVTVLHRHAGVDVGLRAWSGSGSDPQTVW